MQITLGRATGVIFTRDRRKRGFLLMIRGWTFNYVHFLDSNIGISWSRALDIGKPIGARRWWFTEDWQLWAKKDKHGFMHAVGGRAKKLK